MKSTPRQINWSALNAGRSQFEAEKFAGMFKYMCMLAILCLQASAQLDFVACSTKQRV